MRAHVIRQCCEEFGGQVSRVWRGGKWGWRLRSVVCHVLPVVGVASVTVFVCACVRVVKCWVGGGASFCAVFSAVYCCLVVVLFVLGVVLCVSIFDLWGRWSRSVAPWSALQPQQNCRSGSLESPNCPAGGGSQQSCRTRRLRRQSYAGERRVSRTEVRLFPSRHRASEQRRRVLRWAAALDRAVRCPAVLHR